VDFWKFVGERDTEFETRIDFLILSLCLRSSFEFRFRVLIGQMGFLRCDWFNSARRGVGFTLS